MSALLTPVFGAGLAVILTALAMVNDSESGVEIFLGFCLNTKYNDAYVLFIGVARNLLCPERR